MGFLTNAVTPTVVGTLDMAHLIWSNKYRPHNTITIVRLELYVQILSPQGYSDRRTADLPYEGKVILGIQVVSMDAWKSVLVKLVVRYTCIYINMEKRQGLWGTPPDSSIFYQELYVRIESRILSGNSEEIQ